MSSDSYYTILSQTNGHFREKGSRFLSFAHPVRSEAEAKILLDSYRKIYHDARHHCFAWVIGNDGELTRSSDDGEPSGTAGKPILNQISSRNLTYTSVFVIRYFGGVLLGTSGLIAAYKMAASDALEKATIIKQHIMQEYIINFPYAEMNTVMKILKDLSVEQSEQRFETECSLIARVKIKEREQFHRAFLLHPEIKLKESDT